jgi:serine O-acetyltransferase
MIDELTADVDAALEHDPAATSLLEVVLLYPGVHALFAHRIAHRLHGLGLTFWARALSQFSRFVTGIEIHPGATVGTGVFIDHGMGVVVGETAEVGDDVVLYHGVTLGGVSSEREKRHPTVEDGAMLGADSTVIGPITVGEGAKVGAGAVVVEPVAPGETVVGVPAEPVGRETTGTDVAEREADDRDGGTTDGEDGEEDRDCETLEEFERRAMGLTADNGAATANSET